MASGISGLRSKRRSDEGRESTPMYSTRRGERFSALPTCTKTSGETEISRPCSIQVYHVSEMPASAATSSRRSPGTCRPDAASRPTSCGRVALRRTRRNAPRSWRREASTSPTSSTIASTASIASVVDKKYPQLFFCTRKTVTARPRQAWSALHSNLMRPPRFFPAGACF